MRAERRGGVWVRLSQTVLPGATDVGRVTVRGVAPSVASSWPVAIEAALSVSGGRLLCNRFVTRLG